MQKQLIAKVFITGRIIAETGLHIGGSKSSLDIGGVDLNVIKTPNGVPFIPGSSLKGKLRSLLAKLQGSVAVNKKDAKKGELTDEEFPYLLQLFGSSGDEKEEGKGEITRLLVRDSRLNEDLFKTVFENAEMDLDFTDVKWENSINRKTGTAKDPRQLERVPAGAEFCFELVYDLYDDGEEPYTPSVEERAVKNPLPPAKEQWSKLKVHFWAIKTAMQLLQDDYLGGQGSRGYGKVGFKVERVHQKSIGDSSVYGNGTLHEIVQGYNFEALFSKSPEIAIID